MILGFIGLCACAIVLSVTIIICELMYEVHKEIKAYRKTENPNEKSIPINFIKKWCDIEENYYLFKDFGEALFRDWEKEHDKI